MVNTHKPIVVGVDGTEAAARAIRWAQAEADLRGAELELLHAYTMPIVGGPVPLVIPAGLFRGYLEQATAAISRSSEVATSTGTTRVPRTRVVEQPAAYALRCASATALMTVVGARPGHRTALDAILGSTATTVAEHGNGPIVVVRPPNGDLPMTGPILVGLDGSTDSDAALAFAHEEASLRQVALIAVHSWPGETIASRGGFYPAHVDTTVMNISAHRHSAEQLRSWIREHPTTTVRHQTYRGRAADAILHSAALYSPAMIVVGSRGRPGLVGLVVGSTSRQLLTQAPCPVVVVRGNGSQVRHHTPTAPTS